MSCHRIWFPVISCVTIHGTACSPETPAAHTQAGLPTATSPPQTFLDPAPRSPSTRSLSPGERCRELCAWQQQLPLHPGEEHRPSCSTCPRKAMFRAFFPWSRQTRKFHRVLVPGVWRAAAVGQPSQSPRCWRPRPYRREGKHGSTRIREKPAKLSDPTAVKLTVTGVWPPLIFMTRGACAHGNTAAVSREGAILNPKWKFLVVTLSNVDPNGLP